jgi:ABC-type nitrate/sulfonate/bicarbonate transport system permease component
MIRPGLAAVESAAPAPVQPLRARLSASPVALKIAGGVLILAAWEAIVRATAPAYVAKPSGIAAALPRVLANPAVLSAAGITLSAVVEGLFLAVVFGTLLGLATGSIRIAERALGIYVNGLYAMPMVAIVPLLTIWFGYTSAARLATIVFASFFPVAMNVCDGARSVPPEYLEVARAFRARPRHIWLGITLPSSLPYVLAGIRLAVGRALVGAVVAEFVISIDGLGFYILFQSRTFHHNEALVAVLLLAFFAVLVDAGIDWLVRTRLRWYRPGEKAA